MREKIILVSNKEKLPNLSWVTVQVCVNDLIPQEINPRKISDKQLQDLKRSLEKYNLVEIPAIDLDGTILAGHQRIKVLKLLGRGEELIDVRKPNRKLTEEESKEYLLASNALGGDWDFDLLKDFDIAMLNDIGFDPEDLDKIWEDIEIKDEEFSEEKELAKIKETKIKHGDLIILGNHRLICGDSNDPGIVRKLFNGEKTSFIFADPIYNICLDYDKGLGGKQNYGANVKDDRSEAEYISFIKKNIANALTVANHDCHVFYWNTEQQIWILQTLYKELGIKNKRVCLWIKNGQNPTPSIAFSKCYEPCIYGTRGSPYLSKNEQGLNEVLNTEITTGNNLIEEVSNLWAVKRLPSNQYEHATSKPSELYERAIKRCSKVGDIIFDSFAGSGPLLVACEQLKRKAFLIELEPIFCQLILNRFEKLTGLKGKIISNYEEGEI